MLLAGRYEQPVLVVGYLEKCEKLKRQVCCARAVFGVIAVVLAHRVVKQCEKADDVAIRAGRLVRECESVVRDARPVLRPVDR